MRRCILVCMLFLLLVSCAEKNIEQKTPTFLVAVGEEIYPVLINHIYLFTTYPSTLTLAMTPPEDAKEFKEIPVEWKEKILNAGHVGILYVDEDRVPHISESVWQGVGDKSIQDTRFTVVNVSAVYHVPGVDSQKIVAKSKRRASDNVGWFIFNVKNPVSVFLVNKIMKNDFDEYMGCSGGVVDIIKSGGVSLVRNAEYVPLRLTDEVTLRPFIQKYSKDLEQEKFFILALNQLHWIEKHAKLRDFFGLPPKELFVTPAQIVFGNLKKGTIEPIKAVTLFEASTQFRKRIRTNGFDGNFNIKDWKESYNNKKNGCFLSEIDYWDQNVEVAYYSRQRVVTHHQQ